MFRSLQWQSLAGRTLDRLRCANRLRFLYSGTYTFAGCLLRVLRESESTSVVSEAAHSLGYVSNLETIEELLATLRDADASNRAKAFAAVALGIRLDQRASAWNASIASHVNYRALREPLIGDGLGLLQLR